MKTDFLAKLLMSGVEYWIVARRPYKSDHDEVFVICLPLQMVKERKRDEILLIDLEVLENHEVQTNIFISEPYTPFQIGIRLYDVYDGIPLVGINFREFLIDALTLHSRNIHDYKVLIEKHKNS